MLNYDHQKEIKDTLERMGTRTRAGDDVDEVVRVVEGASVFKDIIVPLADNVTHSGDTRRSM